MFVTATTIGAWAQAPASGTYHIRSAQGTYVEVKGKYYAKPDASESDASTIGVGIGYKDAARGGYRVYSLTGKNPTDGSTIEVYNYVDKAYKIVSNFAQAKIDKKLGTGADKGKKQQALDAMADSICRIYTDDYAYMSLIPEGHYGNKWFVRAKATVPTIPYTVQALGNSIVVGNEVIAGHKCTDVWDWAKQHVLKYLDNHNTDQRLKEMVRKYLDQVKPGTTYYLSYDANDKSFGYETQSSPNGVWIMEEVETKADGLTPGVYNIQNNVTKKFVSVTGKYYAEPDLASVTADNKKDAAIYVNFGRYDRKHPNLYRITDLSNQGRDVVAYIYKGMQKVNSIVDKKLQDKGVYTTLASLINTNIDTKNKENQTNGLTVTIPEITAEQIQADVKTAFDLCAEHYAYMKLIDNDDKTVSLRVDVPKIPAALDLAIQLTKGKDYTFLKFAKEQIDNYFNDASLQTDENLRKLWQQNRDKWNAGTSYYLSADNLQSTNPATGETREGTFQFTSDATVASTKWTLANVETQGTGDIYKGIYRVKNVGGYNGQQYIEVRGRATADASATNDDKVTKPGTILYVNLNTEPTYISSPYKKGETVKSYELLNVRSQGIDVMNGCEATTEDLTELFSQGTASVYDGYIGFGRYVLAAGATFADGHIKNYVDAANKDKFDALMKDFNDNYLPQLKFQVYLIPVDGQKDTYLVRSMVPSVKPIVDFYKANKTDMDNIVVPAVREFLNKYSTYTSAIGFSGEKFTDDDDAIINSWYSTDGGEWHVKNCCEKDAKGNLIKDKDGNYTLSYSTILGSEQVMFDWLKLQMVKALKKTGHDNTIGGYVNMIHYKTPYYLIEGDNHDENGNRGYTGNAELGFANDGLNAGTKYGGSTVDDLTNAGNHAYWTLEPVDDNNYFTVKPIAYKARNNMYYASAYLDFPFQIKGSNVSAVYTVSSSAVESGTGKDENGNATSYQYVKLTKVTDGTIPAAKPVFIEFKQSKVDNTLALQPVLDGDRYTKQSTDLVEGTFLGGYHKGDHQSGATDIKVLIKQKLHNLYKGSLEDKWGVDTDGKDLYLFGYNTNDKYNPYGFYLFSKNSDTNDKTIPANKPFLIQTPSSSPAKIYFMVDGEPTGINAIEVDDNNVKNAPCYNLAGQRVDNNYKGVVIVKGHKFIQK